MIKNLDSQTIEEKAVHELQGVILRCGLLRPRFSTSDKDISVDGYIELYSDEKRIKNGLIGKIPVQIKGKRAKSKSPNHFKYSINVADLREYFEVEGGVLFFVVTGIGDDSPCVFYSALLPFDLDRLLKNAQITGQKTILIKLKPFPSDERDIEQICFDFAEDVKRQRGISRIGILSLEDLKGHRIPIEFIGIAKTMFVGESVLSSKAFVSDTYLYAKTSLGEYYALDKFGEFIRMARQETRAISSGDFITSAVVTIIIDRDEKMEILFCGFKVSFSKNRASVDYSRTGTFSERLKNERLALAILENETVAIDGITVFNGVKDRSFDVEDMQRHVKELEAIETMRNQLAIKTDWDPENLSDNDFRKIDALVSGIVDGNPVYCDSKVEPIANIFIGDELVKVLADEKSDGSYRIVDLLDQHEKAFFISYSLDDGTEGYSRVPAMHLLSRFDFEKICNIDAGRFENSLIEAPIQVENEATACNVLLEMLHAWDHGALCINELSECAQILATRLRLFNPDDAVYLINEAQVKSRLGTLSESDANRLRALLLESAENALLCASICVLLGDEKMAYCYLDKCSSEAKKDFFSWPISNLLSQSVKMASMPVGVGISSITDTSS